MPVNAIAGVVQNHETLIGYIYSEQYPGLEDFDSLWAKVKQDGNLTRGYQYRNHHATWYGPVDYSYTGVTHSKQPLPATALTGILDHTFFSANHLIIHPAPITPVPITVTLFILFDMIILCMMDP